MIQVSENTNSVGIIADARNEKLIRLLKSQGKTVFEFPVFEAKAADLNQSDEKLFANISGFDWLIFSDIFTVEIFLENLESGGADFFDLDNVRICSAGEAVADKLRFRQIHSDVIPLKNTAQAVFSAISDYIEAGFGGLRFLLIKQKDAESELAKLLRENSADVIELGIYERRGGIDPALPKLKALIYGGAIDEFVFGSPEDVFSLAEILNENDLPQILSEVKLNPANEITSQTLSEFNLP